MVESNVPKSRDPSARMALVRYPSGKPGQIIDQAEQVKALIDEALLPCWVDTDPQPATFLEQNEKGIREATQLLQANVIMDALGAAIPNDTRIRRAHVEHILAQTSNEIAGIRLSAVRLLTTLAQTSSIAPKERPKNSVEPEQDPSELQPLKAKTVKPLSAYELQMAAIQVSLRRGWLVTANEAVPFTLGDLCRLYHNIRRKDYGGGNEDVGEIYDTTKRLIDILSERLLPVQRSTIDALLFTTRKPVVTQTPQDDSHRTAITELQELLRVATNCADLTINESVGPHVPPFYPEDHAFLLHNLTKGDFEKDLITRSKTLSVMASLRTLFNDIPDPGVTVIFPEQAAPRSAAAARPSPAPVHGRSRSEQKP